MPRLAAAGLARVCERCRVRRQPSVCMYWLASWSARQPPVLHAFVSWLCLGACVAWPRDENQGRFKGFRKEALRSLRASSDRHDVH